MNRRIRNRTYGGVEAEFGRLDSAIRLLCGAAHSTRILTYPPYEFITILMLYINSLQSIYL
jgi:hypothetical protein